MWQQQITRYQFSSRIDHGSEENSSGKWLVPIPFGDPQETWDKLHVAAAKGVFVSIKKSGPKLDQILGHHLVCVYSRTSDEQAVNDVLAKLREVGIDGTLGYKSDLATVERRDDKLWIAAGTEAVRPGPSRAGVIRP